MTRRPLKALAVAAALAAPAAASGGEGVAPDVAQWEGPHEAPVYFIRADELPIVDIKVVLDAGSARDGDAPGLARLTARSLDQGADGLDADELARRLEDTGARLSTSAGRDRARIHLRSLAEADARDAATALLERILETPSFPAEAVDRQRRQMLQRLRTQRQSAADVGERALYRAMYGDHPYAQPPSGTEAGLDGLDSEAVAAFHDTYYTAPNAGIAIVGDLERAEAEAVAERLLHALGDGEAAPALPAPPEEPARTEVRIEHPSSQTALLMGQPVVARGEEALAYPLRVANQALGGRGMVSRLHQAMREDRGLSYSTASLLRIDSVRGPWIVRSTVQADRDEEALQVLRGELERLAEAGLDEDEVAEAVRHLTGSLPVALASNAALVRELGTMAAYGLPADHLARYIPRMEAVTPDAIREALDARLDLERMVTVLVGPGLEDADREVEAP